ncbi:IMP dehydrogenase [bacterium]|nr:IMP dehydrogenase [FCB group bacterium]MBL7191875.1 IMP dehydrogenase [bacterium]
MNERIKNVGFTFDDLLLIPRKSEILPWQVDLKTKLTNKLSLNIPLISAAMDTVTNSEMAIAMAREGGIGFIHRNMSISKQAEEVILVKRSESGIILNPITLEPDNTVADAIEVMNKYHISGIPIVENGKLAGIITHRDLRFQPEMKQPLRGIMTKSSLITAPMGTTLKEAETILQQYRIEKLPVVDESGVLKGLITFRDIQNQKNFPRADKDSHGRLMVGAAIGVGSETRERAAALVEAGVDAIIVDTAHGHSKGVLGSVEYLRAEYPHLQIVAGNIATAEGAKALRSAGADAVKVGIGPGSICTTRVIAGVGVPQLTAIFDCVEALKGEIPVIADGGIRYSGDIAKAIAAGADSVMIGSLFAGCEESPGESVLYEGRRFKTFRGMGSLEAMREGSKDRYFQEGMESDKLVPEGVTGRVPYKGKVSEVIHQMTGGLRSAMGYCGVDNIREMQTKTEFIQVTLAGLRESHPHDITLTHEAPNYEVRKDY